MTFTDPFFLIGIIGMDLILLAFVLNQLKIWNQDMLAYDAVNALGSLLLIVYGWEAAVWPFVVLNGVWFAYSSIDVVKDVSTRKKKT